MPCVVPTREVVIIAEVPSLGAAVHDLLASAGLDVVTSASLSEAIRDHTGPGSELPKVFVSAPANRPSEIAHRWASGPFASVPLVVVGNRDPGMSEADRIHFVTLPLSPNQLLELVRLLAVSTEPRSSGRSKFPPS
jgi:hypothetical protein